MVEESEDQRCIQVGQGEVGWSLADLLLREGKQQLERVAVGRDGAGADARC